MEKENGRYSFAQKIARSSAQAIGGQLFQFALQIITLTILARILTPDDFGLVAMVTIIVNFINLISGLGLMQATIQRIDIRPEEINLLFWINISLSLFLGAVLILSAPLIADFYLRDELIPIVRVLGIVVFFQTASMQHYALLQRKFEFKKIVFLQSISSFASVIIAVLMARGGYGYWALVAQIAAQYIINSVGYTLLSGWVPSRPNLTVNVAPYLRYGMGLAGSNITNFISRNTDNVVIGKLFDSAELALYQKAYSLLLLPAVQINEPLSRVMLPALSQKQENPLAYRIAYKKAITTLCAISIPIVLFMGALSDDLVLLVLGKQWIKAGDYFVALIPVAAISATNMGTGWVYMSLGHTDRQFRWNVFNSTVVVTAIVVSSQYSVLCVCITLSTVFTLLRIPAIFYCFKDTPLHVRDYVYPMLRSLAASIVAAAICKWMFHVISIGPGGGGTAFLNIFIGAIFYIIFLFSMDACLPGPRMSVKYLELFKLLRSKKYVQTY